ncbi:MAG: hypothetical protein H0T79_20750 [Deltaproteobacteria bacterium]|nr:hypothetical protein [Deltaproteobacteria bacterium]
MTLRDIAIDVALRPASELTTMIVADTMVEEVVGSCPYTPAPTNRAGYEHRGGARPVLGDGTLQPMLEGLATNSPKTATTSTLSPTDDGSYAATLRWERTDQGAPLKWVVETPAPIPLTALACEPGDVYCLGGSVEGTLYVCADDGLNLSELKHCANGCPVSPSQDPHSDESCN